MHAVELSLSLHTLSVFFSLPFFVSIPILRSSRQDCRLLSLHLSVVLVPSIPTRPFTNVSLAGSSHFVSPPRRRSSLFLPLSRSRSAPTLSITRGAAFYDPA